MSSWGKICLNLQDSPYFCKSCVSSHTSINTLFISVSLSSVLGLNSMCQYLVSSVLSR